MSVRLIEGEAVFGIFGGSESSSAIDLIVGLVLAVARRIERRNFSLGLALMWELTLWQFDPLVHVPVRVQDLQIVFDGLISFGANFGMTSMTSC